MIRNMLHAFLLCLMLAPLLACADEDAAASSKFVEGEHYIELEEPRETRAADDEVEVIEFFWYGCSHCYAAEAHVEKWLAEKPDNVRFLRVPATLNRGWLPMARTFYTAEQLGVIHQMHPVLFDALHSRRMQFRSLDDLAALFEQETGIEPERFKKTFESFGVGMKLKEADSLARSYPLTGVPSFVIAGKYVTTAGMAGSYARLLEVTRELSQRELESRNADTDGEAG